MYQINRNLSNSLLASLFPVFPIYPPNKPKRQNKDILKDFPSHCKFVENGRIEPFAMTGHTVSNFSLLIVIVTNVPVTEITRANDVMANGSFCFMSACKMTDIVCGFVVSGDASYKGG